MNTDDFDIDKTISLMVLTTERELEIDASTGYMACFRGTNLRRTIIVIGCYLAQNLDGNSVRQPSWVYQPK